MADLTTLDNVKQYLALAVTTDDAFLTRLIASASAWVRSFLNRDILSQTYTETIDGTGTPRIVVGNYPVTAISSIVISGGDTLTASALSFDQNTITRTDGGEFPFGQSNIVVNYTAGFATTPMDLEEAVIEIVALRYRERARVGTSAINTRGESVTFTVMDVPSNVKTLLRNWKNVTPA